MVDSSDKNKVSENRERYREFISTKYIHDVPWQSLLKIRKLLNFQNMNHLTENSQYNLPESTFEGLSTKT